ncbi:MAG TPA: aminotransferase class III-fold pyridoxal phosphate-dependent enzyme, partial [Cyclobacteriaceae bacterium]
SFTANPIACAAANASYHLLNQPSCRENIIRIAGDHKNYADKVGNNVHVREARTLGTILAIELEAGVTAYDNAIARSIYTYFLDRDILIRPLGNVIYVLPPYVINREESTTIYSAIDEFLDQL